MMPSTGIYLFFLSLVFAFIEIEIEGKHGWAEKLPTWYRKSGFARLYYRWTGRKPLTGYHLLLGIFVFLIFHLVFFTGAAWSFSKELQILSLAVIFMSVEDLLWFIFNPFYTLKNFKKSKIWWHSHCSWFLGLFPLEYLTGVAVSLLLFYISALQDINLFYGWIISLVVIYALVFASALLAPLYRKIYWKMRVKDERDKFNIPR